MTSITLPYPSKVLNPNGRTRNYRYRAVVTKKHRTRACTLGMSAWHGREPLAGATITASWYHPQKRFSPHDDDNLTAWLKAYRDGLADAGIVADDRAFRMGGHTQAKDLKNPRVVLTIEGSKDAD